MKIRILRKDIVSYLFIILLAIACLAIGIRMLIEDRTAVATFGITLSVLLMLVPIIMVLRKN